MGPTHNGQASLIQTPEETGLKGFVGVHTIKVSEFPGVSETARKLSIDDYELVLVDIMVLPIFHPFCRAAAEICD